jgi:hypothetical protein
MRDLFPNFERPVPRDYLNIKPRRRGFGLKVAGVAIFGFAGAIALTPPAATDSPQAAAATASTYVASFADEVPAQKVTALEPVKTPPPVKTAALATRPACTRTTARKDCAEAKAAKAALLAAVVPEVKMPPAPAVVAAPVVMAENKAETTASLGGTQAWAAAEPTAAAEAVAVPARTATRQKVRKPRFADEPPVERLVRVYDQIGPDGRRVPVYRRAGGGYESGSVVNGEYRRAALGPVTGQRYFGLQ